MTPWHHSASIYPSQTTTPKIHFTYATLIIPNHYPAKAKLLGTACTTLKLTSSCLAMLPPLVLAPAVVVVVALMVVVVARDVVVVVAVGHN